MYPKVEIAIQAWLDLEEIATYIGKDNPDAAESFTAKLLEDAYSLDKTPFRGAVIIERSEIRMIVYHSYLILYRLVPADNRIDVLRFWHGARDRKGLKFDF